MSLPETSTSCAILYVDDEDRALKYFRRGFSANQTVHTALSADEGLEILRQHADSIGIIVSDQRMPRKTGVEFLSEVRRAYPRIVRILTTAYSDLDSAIRAVNEGAIYQYVVKPWDLTEFSMVLRRASDYYHILRERDELLALKFGSLQRILLTDRVKTVLQLANILPELESPLLTALEAAIDLLVHESLAVRERPAAYPTADAFDFPFIVTAEVEAFHDLGEQLTRLAREVANPTPADPESWPSALREKLPPGWDLEPAADFSPAALPAGSGVIPALLGQLLGSLQPPETGECIQLRHGDDDRIEIVLPEAVAAAITHALHHNRAGGGLFAVLPLFTACAALGSPVLRAGGRLLLPGEESSQASSDLIARLADAYDRRDLRNR